MPNTVYLESFFVAISLSNRVLPLLPSVWVDLGCLGTHPLPPTSCLPPFWSVLVGAYLAICLLPLFVCVLPARSDLGCCITFSLVILYPPPPLHPCAWMQLWMVGFHRVGCSYSGCDLPGLTDAAAVVCCWLPPDWPRDLSWPTWDYPHSPSLPMMGVSQAVHLVRTARISLLLTFTHTPSTWCSWGVVLLSFLFFSLFWYYYSYCLCLSIISTSMVTTDPWLYRPTN